MLTQKIILLLMIRIIINIDNEEKNEIILDEENKNDK